MFRIGEFSKIAQVSGRLLRYYDEIGLLSPQSIDPETGYRYYSARQLPRLNRILVLKELGLSLEHIAHLLDMLGYLLLVRLRYEMACISTCRAASRSRKACRCSGCEMDLPIMRRGRR